MKLFFAIVLALFASQAFPADVTQILAIQQAQIQKQEALIQKNAADLEKLAGLNSSTTIMQQIQAQATCTALRPNSGWIFAVARSNPARTCQQMCGNLKESQAGPLSCFNALHIYGNDNPFTANETVGLKTYRYNACDNLSFGPNYCCCGN